MTRQVKRAMSRQKAWEWWRGEERHRQMWDFWHPLGLGPTRSTRRELTMMEARRDWRDV